MYIRRNYIKKIEPFINKPVIKIITGMRRTGKSTIMKQIIDYLIKTGINEKRIIYLNMESLDNAQYCDINILHKYIRQKKNETDTRLYLFIDEVQEIINWEKLINSLLADNDADIYITGSNSKLLSGEMATLLTGRYIELHVYPFVFSEFLEIFPHQNIESAFNDFLIFGGMPGIHHMDIDQSTVYQYLSSIRDSVVLKDIVKRNNIRDIDLLERIITFIFDNAGNTMSGRSISDFFKKEHRKVNHETVVNYMNHLESAFIVKRVPRYNIRGKKHLETNEKLFVTDIGLRHAVFGYHESNINLYLENIVCYELLYRGFNVSAGKFDDYEIDFIATKPGEKIYIQVCYLLTDEKVRTRETRPLMQVQDNYPKYILTMDRLPESNDEGIQRKYLPQWLLEE